MKLFSHDHFYSRLKNRSSGSTRFIHRLGRDPLLDWGILVSIAMIISAWFIVSGFLAFRSVEDSLSATSVPTNSGHAATFDTGMLKVTLGAFDSRTSLHNGILRSYTGVDDPSL